MGTDLAWCLLACLAWGICPILDRIGLTQLSPAFVMFIQSTTVSIAIGAYLFSSDGFKLDITMSRESIAVLVIVICALLGGVVGELAYLQSIVTGETKKVVAITSAYPIVTLFLSLAFLGESFSLSSSIGVLLIIGGVFCLSS